MIDIVFPDGNEKEFISLAEKLNLKGLCFVYSRVVDVSGLNESTGLDISSAILCEENVVRKFKGKHLTVLRAPDDQTRLRHIIEQVRPDILIGVEFSRRKDFVHHRASGLNHVLAEIARQKNVSVGFDFSSLLKLKNCDCAVCMGRMSQNIRFARKYNFNMVIASFASSPWHLRSGHDLTSFFKNLGLTAGEVKQSLGVRP